MGCDIHTYAEVFVDGQYALQDLNDLLLNSRGPFDWRCYAMYGFLADVRNYSAIPPLAQPRGLPHDVSHEVSSQFHCGYHTPSWLSVDELRNFDYTQPVENRRCMVQLGPNSASGSGTCAEGKGHMATYRDLLSKEFVRDLKVLVNAKTSRVVFWFDN